MRKIIATLFISLSLLGLSIFGQSKTKKTSISSPVVAQTETIQQKIVRVAKSYRLDPRLFYSLIYAESTFKLNAVSYKGAGCLTQLMPDTARRFGLIVNSQVDERFSNVEKCLDAGAKYLAWLLATFRGDVRLALAGYNAGEGAVIKFGWKIPPFKETVQYVEKICALYYGQSGHGVAMAYNQPLAQLWTSQLYSRWRPRVKAANQVYAANVVSPAMPRTNGSSEKPTEDNSESPTNTPKKPTVTRVQVNEPQRLRTESLSFW